MIKCFENDVNDKAYRVSCVIGDRWVIGTLYEPYTAKDVETTWDKFWVSVKADPDFLATR